MGTLVFWSIRSLWSPLVMKPPCSIDQEGAKVDSEVLGAITDVVELERTTQAPPLTVLDPHHGTRAIEGSRQARGCRTDWCFSL